MLQVSIAVNVEPYNLPVRPKRNGYTFRGGNSVNIVCLPSEMWSTLKENNFLLRSTLQEKDWLPKGINSSHLRVDLFTEVEYSRTSITRTSLRPWTFV